MNLNRKHMPTVSGLVFCSAVVCFLGVISLDRDRARPLQSGGSDYVRLHYDALVVDTHNDVLLRIMEGEDITGRTTSGHSDLVRFQEGGIDIQVFSVWIAPEYIPNAYERANEEIDSLESVIRRASDEIGLARNAHEAETLVKQGKLAAVIGIEGGHHIENDLAKLDTLYRRGMRYMTLTWNNSTEWASSARDETQRPESLEHKGLTPFGRNIVQRMNELGIMVDISHVGEETFWDVLAATNKPVIASHSSCYALDPHFRNLKDEQLKAIAQNGGVVFINFYSKFLDSTYSRKEQAILAQNRMRLDSLKRTWKGDSHGFNVARSNLLRSELDKIRPPLSLLIDHIDHAVKLAGVDHVGLGSDFDGITSSPLGMDDVTHFPNITRELLKRGYSERDVRKILGENFMRVFREVTH
ncbi:MAG: dipeptidase [Bacteroidota bacterium]